MARQVINLDRGFLVEFFYTCVRECARQYCSYHNQWPVLFGIFPAVGQYYKRLKSREDQDKCGTRLAPSIFKRHCTSFTLCENDKACKNPKEVCECHEHCGKVCIDPSKSKFSVWYTCESSLDRALDLRVSFAYVFLASGLCMLSGRNLM